MSVTSEAGPKRRTRRYRVLLIGVVAVVVAVTGLLAAIFVPVYSESKQVQVTSACGASASLSLPQPAWVTIHFAHVGSMPMTYWMNGPGGGMMFDHRGMMGGDTYSFWSNGGSYQCWAGYVGSGYGEMTPVWFNATWGLI